MKEEDFGFETGRVLKEIPGWENSELLRSLQEQIDPNEWVLKTVLLSVADDEDLKRISQEIEQANKRLEEHEAEREDFAFSIFCGSLAGDVDSLLSGLFGSSGPGEGISLEEISEFLQKMNTVNGFDFSGVLQFINHPESILFDLKENFLNGSSFSLLELSDSLAGLCHRPVASGFLSSVFLQFIQAGCLAEAEGGIVISPVLLDAHQLALILVPGLIAGFVYWIACLCDGIRPVSDEQSVPQILMTLITLCSSFTLMDWLYARSFEWFLSQLQTSGRSGYPEGEGVVIPDIVLSLLNKAGSAYVQQDGNLQNALDRLFAEAKSRLYDTVQNVLNPGHQDLSDVMNGVLVKFGYFLLHLFRNLKEQNGSEYGLCWEKILPLNCPAIKQMTELALKTCSCFREMNPSFRAAVGSMGKQAVSAASFTYKGCFAGAGLMFLVVAREISFEQKKEQLLHEKAILCLQHADVLIERLHQYEAELEETISQYLLDELETFIQGVSQMDQGFAINDSDLVIRGNVLIQKKLNAEPQFSSQSEFDELMDSEDPFVL